MDFDPVVERLVDKEVQNVDNSRLYGADQSDSEIEEIEAEPRRPIAAGLKRSSGGVNNGGQAEPPEELDESFLCPLCSRCIPLQKVVSMPACHCLFCDSCLQSVVESELRGTPMKAREDGWHMACPTQTCQGKLTEADCQAIAPNAYRRWCEAANEAFLEQHDAFIHCPNPKCGVPIEKVGGAVPFGLELTGVPEIDRTAPFLECTPSGVPLSRQALIHRATFRYRCAVCTMDFCGGCLSAPYHLGISCKENITQQLARHCRFCDAMCGEALDTSAFLNRPVKMLRKESEQERVDTSWCIEKDELVQVLLWAASVCSDQACRQRLERSCTRQHACGHHCGGVRGERHCLPCLEDPCREQPGPPLPSAELPHAGDECSICWVEPLRQAPAIQLECGHVVHFQCAEKKITTGYPGPEITFGFLQCPLCQERMRHPSLQTVMAHGVKLEAQVLERGLARFHIDLQKRKRRLAEDGRQWSKGEQEAALKQYQYYLCSRCHLPYYGGERRCRPAGEEPAESQYRVDELVCGSCSAGSKGVCSRGHGRDFIEYKCRFCCNVATFFCFGHTHFCDECHSRRPDRNPALVQPCRGARWCKLGVEHPPQGEEFCIGCGACRSTA